MSDTPKDPIDLDNLTDDEVMALGPEAIDTLQEQENAGVEPDADEPKVPEVPKVDPETPGDDDKSGDAAENLTPAGEKAEADADKTKDGEDGTDPNKDPNATDESEAAAAASKEDDKAKTLDPAKKIEDKAPEPEAKKVDPDPKDADKTKAKKEEKTPTLDAATTSAVEFHSKITASFKADGKDIQVRSAEDAIRLMQMGVNYSRRMQEMKPLRAQDAMLRQHGIDTAEKLNQLIDLSKGSKEALQKFLKDKGIDPLDLDPSKSEGYRTPNFQADPKDTAFQEAIDNTIAAEGGKELLQDINAGWDESSKEALREEPSIFQNLLEQKNSGVYGKIKTELEYQRTMGFLADVPFLQAYHQVGDAMQKAGVFGSTTTEVQSNPPAKVAIDTGTRKAATPKTVQPNPDLSSTAQPRTIMSSDDGGQNEPDYSSMSDEEMLKLAPPV